jgi:chemotaxis protein methyltransferase CheR
MTADELNYIATLLKQRSGIVIGRDKMYLLESRLQPIARQRGMKDIVELVRALRDLQEEKLVRLVVEAMTTNESYFFRDTWPFDALRNFMLPAILARGQQRTIRIWSAAASTGQEAYSIAMLLREEAGRLAGWRTEIVGTDISTEVIAKAKAATFSDFEVQRGLSQPQLARNFDKVAAGWQVKEEVRRMADFRFFNLLEDPAPLGSFDIVFCRNVLIYFDHATKRRILESISRRMNPGGVLVLGGAETALGICDRFKPVAGHHGLYGLDTGVPTAATPTPTAATSAAFTPAALARPSFPTPRFATGA